MARLDRSILQIGSAIGALSVSAVPGANTPPRDQRDSHHYIQALRHYGRALSSVREMPDSTSNLLIIILSCILCSIFGYYHGDPSVVSHFTYGFMMMEQYLRRRAQDSKVAVQELKISPLESEIMIVFQRGTAHPLMGSLLRTKLSDAEVPWCCRGRNNNKYITQDVPESFEDEQHARLWWEKVKHFSMHRFAMTTAYCEGKDPKSTVLYQQVQRKICLDALKRWHKVFLPFYYSTEKQKDKDIFTYLQAIILEALYRRASVEIWSGIAGTASHLPSPTPLFGQMVSICREITRKISEGSLVIDAVTLDQNISRALAVVAYTCDDADITADAIALLHEEAAKTSSPASSALLQAVMQVEGYANKQAGRVG
jgi:hypothetical protein